MKKIRFAPLSLVLCHALLIAPALARADEGGDVAQKLTKLYNDTRQDCGGPSKPAFLCSGVLFRATWPSTDYMFYSVSPKSQKSGGISVSYLRKDAKFRRLAYGLKSGFILNPIFGNPKENKDYDVLCSFPIDAATDARAQAGCTDSSFTPNYVEKSCQDLGITTADQWYADYRKHNGDHSMQCSFDVRDDRNKDAAPAFYQSILPMQKMGEESMQTQDELRIAKWEEDPPRSPSVMALFYADDSGVEGARLNQIQWYESTQQYLPIINLQLPQTRQDDAKFVYNERKQAIWPVTAKNSCDRYVQSAAWIWRDDPGFKKKIASLQVVPTDCGRAVKDEQTNNFFNELVVQHYLDAPWKENEDNRDSNLASMRRQLVCHFQIARNKAEWNLEPSRPYTSQQESVAKGCNNL